MVDRDIRQMAKEMQDMRQRAKAAPISDPVNHPQHYTSHPSGAECIEVTRHMNFNLGNAMKYIWRCGDKGKPVEDLQKAIWYLNDEIKRLGPAGQ